MASTRPAWASEVTRPSGGQAAGYEIAEERDPGRPGLPGGDLQALSIRRVETPSR